MADVTVPTAPPLARINGVELMHAGSWQISTGPATFTTDDLAAAVGALDCPAVRRPILKLGHVDPRFDGEPAVGFVDNVATAEGGRTLVGDYVGMPGWLGDVIVSAYPDRSIEGIYDYQCQIGHVHPFVLTGVALLGITRPGIGTLSSLQDIGLLYGVDFAAAGDYDAANGTHVRVTVSAAVGDPHTGAMVALVPSQADIDRLAVDGGEPAGELHLTLMFLGEAAAYDQAAQAALVEALTAAVADLGPVNGDGFAVSIFNAGNDDRETCIVLGVSGPEMEPAHDLVSAAVAGSAGDLVPEQHTPWLPHVTLTYTDDTTQAAQLVDRTGPIVFDRLRVAFAGEVTDIALADSGDTTAAASRSASMPNPKPTLISAGVSVENVRREYYEDAAWSRWITAVELSPLQLIVCDDNTGKYYRVPVTIDGDSFTFSDEVEVVIVYQDVPADSGTKTAASTGTAGRIVYASRAESRPGKDPKAAGAPDAEPAPVDQAPPADPAATTQPPVPPAAEPEPTTPEPTEDTVSDLSEFCSRLGLADDADETALLAALDDVLDKATAPPAPQPEPVAAATTLPDGVTTIDESTLQELRAAAEDGRAARDQQRVEARDTAIRDAVQAGKIPPARVDHWTQAWDADPDGTRSTLASLADGLVVPVAAKGHTGSPEPEADDHEFDHLFPPQYADSTKGA